MTSMHPSPTHARTPLVKRVKSRMHWENGEFLYKHPVSCYDASWAVALQVVVDDDAPGMVYLAELDVGDSL